MREVLLKAIGGFQKIDMQDQIRVHRNGSVVTMADYRKNETIVKFQNPDSAERAMKVFARCMEGKDSNNLLGEELAALPEAEIQIVKNEDPDEKEMKKTFVEIMPLLKEMLVNYNVLLRQGVRLVDSTLNKEEPDSCESENPA